MAMTIAVFVVYVLFAAGVRERIVTRPKVMRWLRRAIAGGFTALGARVAFAEREICPAPPQPSLRATGSRECAPDDRLSEAIHQAASQDLDCFVANAPRVKSSDLGRDGQAGRRRWLASKSKSGLEARRFVETVRDRAGCPGGAGLHPGLKVTSWTSWPSSPSWPFSPSSLS
jgi:hypothetical protein